VIHELEWFDVAVAALLPFAQWTSPDTIGADELF
jgi:hypothetical protein